VNGLAQLFRNLGVARLATLAVVAALSVGFFVFLTSRIATPGYGLLYGDLDAKDSGQIVQKLEASGVPYQLKGDGSAVMVPLDQVARVRMIMADEGLPHGGSVGYEIFDKSDAFGTSSFVENINQVRALEGELERTIASINLISSARVHLVLPRREIFTRERQQPSASIVVKLRGADHLTSPQVAAIQHLVASAVPDLTPDRVSIVDTDGNLLARGGGDNDASAGSNAEDMQANYENRLSRRIEELVERSVGPGKARVDVHVDMDFDRVTTNSESYDPNGQVVRSTQTVTEANDTNEGSATQGVSVANNLPNAQAAAPTPATDHTRGSRNEETINYEISKTVRNQVSEAGQVKRQSVAVLVDGTYVTGSDGARKYTPRNADELKQITALVRSAVGYDEKRGDTVDVENLPFAPVDEPASSSGGPAQIMGFDKSDMLHMGETLILAVVAVLVILLVIRPLVNRVFEGAAAGGPRELGRLLGAPPGTAALPAPSGGGGHAGVPATQRGSQQQMQQQAADGEMIDIGQVDGRVAASSLKKVSEIVEKHPEEALAIVRSWMYQDGR
jgi:flagellar M-ring protein FliF